MHRARRSPLTALFPAVAVAALAWSCAPAGSGSHRSSHAALGVATSVLGTAQQFAVLGGSAVTNIGATNVGGDLGVSPGFAITGFPPGLVTGGATHAADAVSLQAQTDVTNAFNALDAQACSVDLSGTDLGGLTLTPGVYCFSSSAQLTGALVLDAEGLADAVFVFKMASKLTTASSASVRVINGGDACGVFWQVGSSVTLGTGTEFAGSLVALASITLTTGAKVSGRVLARTGAVTMDDNEISLPVCKRASTNDAGSGDAAASDAGSDANAPDAGTSSSSSGGSSGKTW